MLPTGELLIINISHSDAQHTYRCRTYHQLTQEVIVSGNFGRIQLSGKFWWFFPLPFPHLHDAVSQGLDDNMESEMMMMNSVHIYWQLASGLYRMFYNVVCVESFTSIIIIHFNDERKSLKRWNGCEFIKLATDSGRENVCSIQIEYIGLVFHLALLFKLLNIDL